MKDEDLSRADGGSGGSTISLHVSLISDIDEKNNFDNVREYNYEKIIIKFGYDTHALCAYHGFNIGE